MRRNSSRGSASPSTYRGGSGRRRKRRSNRLAKCAAFIVGAYALVASLFYYRATHHDVGPRLRGSKEETAAAARAGRPGAAVRRAAAAALLQGLRAVVWQRHRGCRRAAAVERPRRRARRSKKLKTPVAARECAFCEGRCE